MPDCEYCDATFDGETEYVEHLAATHDGELSTIDQRRVQQHETADSGGRPVGTYVGVVVALVLVAGLGYAGVTALGSGGSSGGSSGGAAETGPLGLPLQGDDPALQRVERVDSQGNQHVPSGTDIDYERIPPLSGPHYGGAATDAGFYTDRPAFGSLVHTLEHGAVVIYYDPSALPDDVESHLRSLTEEYTGPWSSVVVVPHPSEDPDSTVVLTAWRTQLTLDSYDRDAVMAFLAEYLGRGPENPVRE